MNANHNTRKTCRRYLKVHAPLSLVISLPLRCLELYIHLNINFLSFTVLFRLLKGMRYWLFDLAASGTCLLTTAG